MRMFTRLGAGLLGVIVATGIAGTTAHAEDSPPVPPTPAMILDVVSVQTFTMEKPATHAWRAERPQYTTGYLMVLKVDAAYVVPRQVGEPVLYVGNQTAERINHGDQSGHVVVVVPAVTDPKHPDYLDLAKAKIWFGTPELPEQVDARTIEREDRIAEAALIPPAPQGRLDIARTKGGAMLRVVDKGDVIRAAAKLIEKHSPQERTLVETLLQR